MRSSTSSILLFGALTEAALVLGTGVTAVTRQQMLDAVERLVGAIATPATSPSP